MSKLTIPDKTRNNYRLTGIGCVALNETSFTVGTRNIAGGHVLKIASYDATQRKLTIFEGEMGKLAPGMALFLWTCADDDNSPYELKIATVDQVSRTVTLTQNLPIKSTLLNTAADWIGAVVDKQRDAAAFASGDLCFAVGNYAYASGSLTLASGFGAHAEGILCEARGDMSFAIGNMTVASGIGSLASGSNTRAGGMFSTASGSSTVAAGDNSVATGSGSEAGGDGAMAGGFQSKASGRVSLAHGSMSEASGDYSTAIGYRAKARAKYATVIGKDADIPDTVDYEAAFAVGGGDNDDKSPTLLVRSRKPVINPLYNPSLDPDHTGTDTKGEKQYLPKAAFTSQYRGRLIGTTYANNAASGLIPLDHDLNNRWKIKPIGTVILEADNWQDGDWGELIIYDGGSRVQWPAAWAWLSSPPGTLGAVAIFMLYQLDNKLFIASLA